MTIDPEQQADVLKRLALGELSEDDPEASAVLDASAEARAEWAELSRAIRRLERSGGEERDVIERSMLNITQADRALAQDFFGPRLATVRVRRRRLRIVWFAPLATAALALLVWALVPGGPGIESPGGAGIGLMSGWEGDVGLELAAGSWSGASVRLAWRHDRDHARVPGTTYDVVLVDPGDGSELAAVEGRSAPEWSAVLPRELPGELLWRVEARSAEGVEYAAANGRLLPSR